MTGPGRHGIPGRNRPEEAGRATADAAAGGSQEGARYRVSAGAPWSPAQLVAVAVGVVLVVIGGVALARGGINFSDISLTHSTVAGLHYTCLSALVQLVVGVIIIGGGAYPDSAKGTMAFFGVVLVAFGLIVAIDPTAFATTWGYTEANGVFYIVVGVILGVAAAISPVFTPGARPCTRRPRAPSRRRRRRPRWSTPPVDRWLRSWTRPAGRCHRRCAGAGTRRWAPEPVVRRACCARRLQGAGFVP